MDANGPFGGLPLEALLGRALAPDRLPDALLEVPLVLAASPDVLLSSSGSSQLSSANALDAGAGVGTGDNERGAPWPGCGCECDVVAADANVGFGLDLGLAYPCLMRSLPAQKGIHLQLHMSSLKPM